MISGKVLSTEKEIIDFATVYLKGTNYGSTNYGSTTNLEGIYHIKAPAGEYTLVVSAIGYKTTEVKVTLTVGERIRKNVTIAPETTELDEVVILSNGVSRIKRSAFNAVAIDTKALQHTTQNLSSALAQAPGMKLRESGGVGSDMQLMMDGFSGKHIKIFIDGVPQEGVGASFGLNNIPVNYAERIEIYRGVVPVGLGTDAIGGVINIVTKKNQAKWFLDASYSYGSFNTHKSYINFGQTLKNGFTYEINAFQNYSDNSYYIDTPVKEFIGETGSSTDESEIEHVKRFHDTYHSEAVVAKIGVVAKKWADRLLVSFTYSQMYKEIQNGVLQQIVYGDKHRKGHTVMPALEYRKRDLFIKGLDVSLTANYNKNIVNNVDTSSYEYNWRGEKRRKKSGVYGEQSYQHTRSDNNNWNGTFTANYHLNKIHLFTLNHVLTDFKRNNQSLLTANATKNPIPKETVKNISGLSYRLMPNENWNLSVFGKYYNIYSAGPVATTTNQDDFVRVSNSVSSTGYGAAGTYFILRGLQAKLSYEKAYRLPSNEEMFGDEDLETGDIGIKPENSDNVNLNLSYNEAFGKHSIYVEGGLIYRDTKDYIVRQLTSLGGGNTGAGYTNHGRVETKGYNLAARYGFARWISIGGNFTQINVRSKVKTSSAGSSQENAAYGARIPNTPYRFANSDVTLLWHDLGRKGNLLTVTYDNMYVKDFPLRSEAFGDYSTKDIVPSQFSHNLVVSYSFRKGRYSLSFECRNFTNEKLYDDFSLQKAGRVFNGKMRVCL
ncbi:TonB-dependent receptor [Bacteroides sp. 519]|uniref:TonB-dependent receptor n=1 Tax=Bacteroides sp. 519 TaxID=2302937 RepID=UPI0013D2C970|nr:TonB-dependent receptor [Bacteroides sp. 519]NDV57800.1 TonB-dependent receptor [Bacteroides sp. 519]